ncbi:glutamate-1-semialdehyde 2,1-aminomutase [Candidatus Methylacidithermus pantelleriae]|uniref:Glutamate-1-semialdehyde 2,1-aminomutase n=1 Tax=Candidatus Methylacidithermus pantelleriae TaxID=2744239 RepID=A0A8J2BQF4_9BACT|nr:glutamate-1-semialdehyde 2,1-aminomutase [Candidatus Methylacidithermus pantelleriae]CAF0698972.1 Glutamate-1-semialdehyde 2,1-aminomutase [Candidatus Methylacidithermus pantelleriae]
MVKNQRPTSSKLYLEAQELLVGGVNSPVRTFGAVQTAPLFVSRARGSRLWDVDGNEFLDYLGSWGAAILGHAAGPVIRAIQEAATKGTSFGLCHPLELRLAQKVCQWVPSVERLRLTSSGTEACLTAVRLARGVTGREKIIKFEGAYHGHGDSLLVRAGSGALAGGHPDSAGVPAWLAAQTLVVSWNDLPSLKEVFRLHGKEVAGIILEPVLANCGVIPPEPGFLEEVMELARQHGSLVIWDEVITGFRLGPAGAQGQWGLRPDLTTFGKVLGGGLPLGALGGRKEIMERLAPCGDVYHAGTLSGNPVAVAAGLAQLEELEKGGGYAILTELGELLEQGIREVLRGLPYPVCFQRCGSLFSFFFTEGPIRNFRDARRSDPKKFARFFAGLLERGILLAPSPWESSFLSVAHTENDVEWTVRMMGEVLRSL